MWHTIWKNIYRVGVRVTERYRDVTSTSDSRALGKMWTLYCSVVLKKTDSTFKVGQSEENLIKGLFIKMYAVCREILRDSSESLYYF